MFSQSMLQNVGMMCNKVTMPSRDINTKSHITHGPRREMPYAYSYSSNIEMSFYGDCMDTCLVVVAEKKATIIKYN